MDTPDVHQQKYFYDEYWKGLKPIGAYKMQRTQWIMNVLLAERKKIQHVDIKLLDLGCGDGRLVPLWNVVAGGTAYGLELSPQAVATAGKMYPFINYAEGDATRTPYANEMFDIIVCQEVIEHVEGQQQLINECNRILKKGGTLILTTPNKFYFDRRAGGNYSQQPIENIIDKKQLLSLLQPSFNVESFETLIYAKGDKGVYTRITNRYWLAILRMMGLSKNWKQYLLSKGYGLHMAVVCRK
jgi:2-polyprenyl-3-methyl-5-hydroxy-6-metoxy-1,4-benzoquinol methylase